jgi:hypothetical protein
MKSDKYLNELKDIQKIAGQIRTINESIRFGEEFGDEADFDQNYEPEPEPEEEYGEEEVAANGQGNLNNNVKPEDAGLKELQDGGELDKIREITLRGMMQLNNTPEDPKFQALLKIFNICNKAVNDNSEQEQQK